MYFSIRHDHATLNPGAAADDKLLLVRHSRTKERARRFENNAYCSFQYSITSRKTCRNGLRGNDYFCFVYLFWTAGGVALDFFVAAVNADTVGIHSQRQPAEQVRLRSSIQLLVLGGGALQKTIKRIETYENTSSFKKRTGTTSRDENECY